MIWHFVCRGRLRRFEFCFHHLAITLANCLASSYFYKQLSRCGTGPSPALLVRSNEYPLDLVERHFFGAPVVKLCCACRGMVRHLRRTFERSAVLQISRNARRPE